MPSVHEKSPRKSFFSQFFSKDFGDSNTNITIRWKLYLKTRRRMQEYYSGLAILLYISKFDPVSIGYIFCDPTTLAIKKKNKIALVILILLEVDLKIGSSLSFHMWAHGLVIKTKDGHFPNDSNMENGKIWKPSH